ncbi:MAG TPA: PqqD family protein [Polyangia bacterium]
MTTEATQAPEPLTTWQRRPELPFQVVADDVLVVDPATRAVHLFNRTAARIWMLLSSPRSLDDLTNTLADEYDAPIAELRAEVASFIADLRRKGLCAGPDVAPTTGK